MSLKEFGVELLSRILLGLIVNVLSVSCVRGEVLYCEKEKEVLAGQWFNIQEIDYKVIRRIPRRCESLVFKRI